MYDAPHKTAGNGQHADVSPRPQSFFYRLQPTDLGNLDEVGTMTAAEYGRLMWLCDMASRSPQRWHIQSTDDVIRKRLAFGSVKQWLMFAGKLIAAELLYIDDDGFYVMSPRLCPHDKDYPSVPTPEESLKNLELRKMDVPSLETHFRAIMLPKERKAVQREWEAFAASGAAAGFAVPAESDRRRFRAAREEFQAAFLPHYRAGRKPADALAAVQMQLTLTFRALFPLPVAPADPAPDPDTTPETEPINDSEIVTSEPEPSSEIVTFFSDVTPSASRVDTQSQIQKESHNNNSLSPIVTRDAGRADGSETAPPVSRDQLSSEAGECHEMQKVTHFVPTPDEAEKAVVVALLCEKGKDYALSQNVAEDFVVRYGVEQCRKQLYWLMFRRAPKPEKGTRAGQLRDSIANNWPAPPEAINAARSAVQRAEAQRQKQEAETETAAARARAAARAQQWQEYLAGLPEEERESIEVQVRQSLSPILHQKLCDAEQGGLPAPHLVAVAMEEERGRIVEARLRGEDHAPNSG